MNARLKPDQSKIAEFCRRWQITELAFFGSVLRDDFGSDSDVDVLVGFAPGSDWSLLDHAAMQDELAALLNRKIDLVTRRAVEKSDNWIRRKNILSTAEPVYVAR